MMRRFGIMLAASALLVLTVAAPASAGQTTSDSSGSALTAQGGWNTFDPATGSSEYGWVTGWHASIVTAPVLGASPTGPLMSVVPGIFVAGQLVGARTFRRWIIIGLLTFGLVVAVGSALLIGFLLSFT